MSKIRALTGRLAALSAGERCWFWFCPSSPALPLLVEPFAEADGMARLLRRAGSLPPAPGARVCTGILAVAADGALHLASPLFQEGMLEALAGWVRTHLPDHPELARLSGAQLLRLDARGAILERFADPSRWDGIARPPVAGTLGGTAETLGALEAGQDAWIWLSEGKDAPATVAVAVEDDREATRFGALVVGGRVRAQQDSPGLRGLARRMLSGSLLITTADPLDRIGPQLSGWLAGLGDLRLVQLRDGEIAAGRRFGGDGDNAPSWSPIGNREPRLAGLLRVESLA